MPKYDDFEELKTMVAHKLDVQEFLDILGVDMFTLVEKFEDEIEENYEKLVDSCR